MQQSNKTIHTTRNIVSISTHTVKIQLFIKKNISCCFLKYLMHLKVIVITKQSAERVHTLLIIRKLSEKQH